MTRKKKDIKNTQTSRIQPLDQTAATSNIRILLERVKVLLNSHSLPLEAKEMLNQHELVLQARYILERFDKAHQ